MGKCAMIVALIFVSMAFGIQSLQLKHQTDLLEDCREQIVAQEKVYGDLCAEESTGYEDMPGSEAHYFGVKCAVDSIVMVCGRPNDRRY